MNYGEFLASIDTTQIREFLKEGGEGFDDSQFAPEHRGAANYFRLSLTPEREVRALRELSHRLKLLRN